MFGIFEKKKLNALSDDRAISLAVNEASVATIEIGWDGVKNFFIVTLTGDKAELLTWFAIECARSALVSKISERIGTTDWRRSDPLATDFPEMFSAVNSRAIQVYVDRSRKPLFTIDEH